MVQHKTLTTDEDIQNALLGSAAAPEEPVVVGAALTSEDDQRLFSLKMSDGSRHLIPVQKLEHLSNAPDETVLNFEVRDGGLGIRWPELDLDLYVPALLHGVYGTEKWMSSLGQRGGRSRSEAKVRAARENGRKGGRPRKAFRGHSRRLTVEHVASPTESRREYSDYRQSQGRLPLHVRASFAVLFGLEEQSSSRPLPRIA